MTGTSRLLRLVLAGATTAALTVDVAAGVAAQNDEVILDPLVAHETTDLDAWYGTADPGPYVAAVDEPDEPDAPNGPWNVTKVMTRTADGWEMLHRHFSSPVPPPTPAE